ncbi:hypothetical protein SO802_029238 [Lithocarpus litseifolius]|uniref:Uncharacterized protein n=1 Tax=Lithocarpus litseifolius TaxID=425828 RepID=A0AAW2BW27_9ROSI
MSGVNPEQSNFHQVVDDDAAMFMTNLVKGYGEIHVFVEHPVHEPLELPVEDAKTLEVFVSDSELQSDHYYEYGDEEYRPNFSQFGRHDNAEFTNVDYGEQYEVDAEQDNQAKDDEVEPGQMGGGVINSDYESEELLSLNESSSSSEDGDDSSDDDIPIAEEKSRSRYDPIIEPINGQNMWRPSGLPPMQLPIKRRPPGRPKKKRALEPNEPRSHRKRGSRHLKTMQVMWEIRTQQEELQGRTKDGHAISPAVGNAQLVSNAQPTVHRAQPSSNDDVTTSAPPPPTDNLSNPRPKRQKK